MKCDRRPLLSDSGVAQLNLELVDNALRCRAVKEHQFATVLRRAVLDDNDNTFVDIQLDPKTVKKYQKNAHGLLKAADVKSDSRLKPSKLGLVCSSEAICLSISPPHFILCM